MIVVTGASGFIGRNLVNLLRNKGEKPITVDFHNFVGDIDYDPFIFLKLLKNDEFSNKIDVVFHQGASSDTTCYDPHYMMKVNFNYSVQLLNTCLEKNIRLIYASSASVYGDGPFDEDNGNKPKNLYAKTKYLFDEYVKCFLDNSTTQIIGLRYFNVFGPLEDNKGKMASVVKQFFNQIKQNNKIKIFKNSENYLRDFVHIDDVLNVNMHFFENDQISGIYNCGTSKARSFYDIAKIMNSRYNFDIQEIAMPNNLINRYQK